MCGIAGIHFKSPADPSVLDRHEDVFRSAMRHRGPDAFGAHRSAHGLYTNSRLSIVDRQGGDQPIYSHDRHRGIVYNGEVYNWAELRAGIGDSWSFRTHTDTEAVLAAVLQDAAGGLAKLNGMFALCVWDDRDGSLLLARDRFGAKPLYVYEDDEKLAFASELRTLLSLDGLDHALDPIGFQDILSYRYALAPRTMFRRISKLTAGCALSWRAGRSAIMRFAELGMHEAREPQSEPELLQELDLLLEKSVRGQLMGEVPIGVLLSGGLDSSTIAAYVQRAGARLKAYSIGFPEVNEFAYSREVARQFDLDYTEVLLTQEELRQRLDPVLQAMDEPMADPASFALSRLCESIRKDVTVVLSGEGGDELFAGYAHHQLCLQPGLDRDLAYAHFFLRSANFTDANQFLREKSLPPHHLRLRAHFDRADSILNGMQAVELHGWLPENLMMKADKVLMSHSLEGRFPFLDNDLMSFASRLPQSARIPHAGASKHLLRRLMQDRLPRSVLDRQKMGFTVPPSFFLHGLRERLLASVERLRAGPVDDVLDLQALGNLIESYYRGEPVPALKLWNVAVLLLWWTDVYPGLRPTASGGPSAPSAAQTALPAQAVESSSNPARRRLVVYTALVGAKEELANPLTDLPTGSQSDLDLEFVCLTDDVRLESDVWSMRTIQDQHLPPEKLSRRPKALPHEYFPDAEFSLYIDNTVSFKRLPMAADLPLADEKPMRAFRHSNRNNPLDEAMVIAMLGYDDTDVICRQMDFYASRVDVTRLGPLTTGTVLMRRHHDARVKHFGRVWWESILAFSKRDQLSIDFALRCGGVQIEPFEGDTVDNGFINWRGSLSPRRVKANFDAKRYSWVHRDDPEAVADPRKHFLKQAGALGEGFERTPDLLDYVCHSQGSSLGSHVSPRRDMARTLQTLLESHRRAGQRYLIVRIRDRQDALAFSSTELEAATRALSMYLAPAVGTLIDLGPQDLGPGGKVYVATQETFGLLILLGVGPQDLGVALEQTRRLLDPSDGTIVAALAGSLPLSTAADIERALVSASTSCCASASLHASRHDSLKQPVVNSLLALNLQACTQTVEVSP